jgi:endoglucanase
MNHFISILPRQKKILGFLVLCILNIPSLAQQPIRVNQIGFYTHGPKVAVIPGEITGGFKIVNAVTDEVVYTGETGNPQFWQYSEETVVLADFTGLTLPGKYYVLFPPVGTSHKFNINDEAHRELTKAALRAFYYNRASIDLEKNHAGSWHRPAGHPDTVVYVHTSASSSARPEGSAISSPKGWYDAGDFNKYIVNSGISTFTLLAAYEHFPDFFSNLYLNIPESKSPVPDILSEARWNLEWMLTMQDPNDGGVYHKLTHLSFQGIMMPHYVTADRYVVMKSTGATLNFSAVMAVAARVYSEYDPEFANSTLKAAEYAWEWAMENPEVYYIQPPDVHTGQYGDNDLSDEFDWAAAELYITTRNNDYWYARDFQNIGVGVPTWQYVRPLAWVSLSYHSDNFTDISDIELIKQNIIEQADLLLEEYVRSAYRITMGAYREQDFVWGSNGVAANQSLMLLQAYRLTENKKYLDAAQANLDYILGRNATGYSFVTGYGSYTPMYPHHRVSAADEQNADPVPGFVVGGPNPNNQYDCNGDRYPSNLPALSYLDDWCSYSTNEVAINWNAPLVYIAGAMEYYRHQK